MFYRIIHLLLAFFLLACDGDVVKPYASYEASLDEPSALKKVENRLRRVAVVWNMEILEKDRGNMEFITQGKSAIFFAFYFENIPVLIVTNAGAGDILVVSATGYGDISLNDLADLVQDVLRELSELGLEFRQAE